MKHRLLISAATAMLALVAVGAAQASTWIATGTGADGALKAQADITVSANKLVISLTDLIANPTSAGQEISGIQIFLASAPTSASLTSATGTLIDINAGKKGAPNSFTIDTSDVIDHWSTAISGSSIYLATAGTGSKGGKPIDLIIDGGGNYSNANPSITGRNPQIEGTGVFTLSLLGQPTPMITAVKIEFGTTPDTTLSAMCSTGCGTQLQTAVPEPTEWALMILGFGAVGAGLRRRRAADLATARTA